MQSTVSSVALSVLSMPDILFEIFKDITIEEDPFRPMYSLDALRKRQNAMQTAIRISTVCKVWRSTALSMSQLWTTIPSIILPLEGTRKSQKIFAECIATLVQRGSHKGLIFYMELRSGIYRSNCHRVIESLLQCSPDWYSVCINILSIDAFHILNRIPDSLDRLNTVSLIFKRPLDDHRCIDIGPFLRRVAHLHSLQLNNAHVVDAKAWNDVPKHDLQSFFISANGFTPQQETSFKQLSIPDVEEFVLRTKYACPATIVTEMIKNSTHNAIRVLSLHRDSERPINDSVIPMLLKSLPLITIVATPLPSTNDINILAKEISIPTLQILMFSVNSVLKNSQDAQTYGPALRTLGQTGKYKLKLTEVPWSHRIIDGLEGWDDTEAHHALSIAASKLINSSDLGLKFCNDTMNILSDIRAMNCVTFGDIQVKFLNTLLIRTCFYIYYSRALK